MTKIIGLYFLLTFCAAFGNCKPFATRHNAFDAFDQLEEFLAFVEFLAKELEEAVIATVKDIEVCFPMMVERGSPPTYYNLPPPDYYVHPGSDYSSEIGSCLWDKLRDLVRETFDTIRDIFKRILGIRGALKAIQLQLNSGANIDQPVDDQKERVVDPLNTDKENNEEIAKRIEAVFKSVEISFELMLCYLNHEDTK